MPIFNHRVVVNPGSLPFAGYPIKLETTTPFVVNYEVISTGRGIRSLGKRIYDASILPASGSITVQPNSPLLFPFITNELPTAYFDAVFLLKINGIRYIQGFSNSPDNVAAYTSNYFLEEKKMFGVYLKCFGVNGANGNSDTNNHYMFGGENTAINGDYTIRMAFDVPTSTALTITSKFTFYSLQGDIAQMNQPPVVIPIGSIDYQFPPFNLYGGFLNTGYYTYDKSGYYMVEFVPSDPSYVSILPFYHWGQFS